MGNESTDGLGVIRISDGDFVRLTEYLRNRFGINLTKKRVLIEGRLNQYLVRNGYDNYTNYLDAVFADPTGAELSNILNYLTTNYSFFMREWEHFEFYRTRILPELKETVKDHDLRLWSAGCSTGEEAYTLSMVTGDFFGADAPSWDRTVLATDISRKVLNFATAGAYSAEAVEPLPKGWKLAHFTKLPDGRYQAKESLRKEVLFRPFNLMEKSFPFKKKFHVIFCRNVMIYFEPQTKIELVGRFYDALAPGGYLIVGQSESLDRSATRLSYVMPSIYHKV
ncbi:MAG: protein-glutamate O-methyltransferase CheR [Clostridiaceae bacterium]|nr:protein-glutamate O-methyltransferase CheR [Eubacteriales bacterium]